MTNDNTIDPSRHPCFNAGVKGRFGRVHLPVAPACNIKCNYCNRKYDCVNESRPGVTSTVLSPEQSVVYMERVVAAEPRITVAGIAGPGDPFANGEATMATLRAVRARFPQLILCLASNGMAIGPYIPELAELQVSHVTITVNAVDPAIGAKIYGWVQDGKVVHQGRSAAELLLARQLAAISLLKKHGITVKVNTIIIPGVNDHHIPEVARSLCYLGVDLLNCMALFPNADTPFAGIVEPSREMVTAIRRAAEAYLPQMRHCTRCRADAVGLLDQDRTEEMRGCLSACAKLPPQPPAPRPYVAVATMEGVLVNQHLGEAKRFQIWEKTEEGFRLVTERAAPEPGLGMRRWLQVTRILGDCRALLVGALGEKPAEIINKSGLATHTMAGFIEDGLRAVYEGGNLSVLRSRREGCPKGDCAGSGGGCL